MAARLRSAGVKVSSRMQTMQFGPASSVRARFGPRPNCSLKRRTISFEIAVSMWPVERASASLRGPAGTWSYETISRRGYRRRLAGEEPVRLLANNGRWCEALGPDCGEAAAPGTRRGSGSAATEPDAHQ